MMRHLRTPATLTLAVCLWLSGTAHSQIKDLSVDGSLRDGKARITVEGLLTALGGSSPPVYSARVEDIAHVSRTGAIQQIQVAVEVLQGKGSEFALTLGGDSQVQAVSGEWLLDWSVRRETNGNRVLVLRTRSAEQTPTNFLFKVAAMQEVESLDDPISLLTLRPPHAALLSGHVRIQGNPDLRVDAPHASGVIPVPVELLPESLRAPTNSSTLTYRIQGLPYELPVRVSLADPEATGIALRNFALQGRVEEEGAVFTLTAVARVTNPRGATVELLSGDLALNDLTPNEAWRVRFQDGKFLLVVDEPGDFPIQVSFTAAVRHPQDASAGWRLVQFRAAPAALAPLSLAGLAADTQFRFPGAARPERVGNEFVTFLPTDGSVNLAFKEDRVETEGRLFYSAEMLSQVTVSPGLVRQTALITGKVMQGELSRLNLEIQGEGEIARVQGDQILSWNLQPGSSSGERVLAIQFNQPQKDQFRFHVQIQTGLGEFPAQADITKLRPVDATRFAGYYRLVNEGAVRLEVTQADGLSQVSPEQFPKTEASGALFTTGGSQQFVFRFSSGEFNLGIEAGQILPEITASQITTYRLGESDLVIEGEIELEIREAPLREFLLTIPRDYSIVRLTAPGLADYFVSNLDDGNRSELRLVFSNPVAGRELITLRLEQNRAFTNQLWELPEIEFFRVKSVRGHIGVLADPGFRLSPEGFQGLTEVATAFFPRKVPGLQAAFRLNEPDWSATLRVERLPQTIHADVMHLFSIGEGLAYGSSVISYQISGSPMSFIRIELSDEYYNVEFSGKDIRSWQKAGSGYEVQLHTPVSGPYTLLATYERPFRAQGDTLTFTGARPLDAQSEQGHTLLTSAYQFEVKPTDVSPGLIVLEPAEVPAEYRLFSDAPLLAAFRYTSRPFNLRLALSPLVQGDSLSLVVDRASLAGSVSKEGQVLTTATYFVKNRGNPHLSISLPPDAQLWSATVNGSRVVPVRDTNSNLVPLPQRADPNEVLRVELKLASRSENPRRLRLAAPAVHAPVMLAEWNLQADTGQRLVYSRGTLTPENRSDVSGFNQLWQTLQRDWMLLLGALVMAALAIALWRWASGPGVFRFSARHISGSTLGMAAAILALVFLAVLANATLQYRTYSENDLRFIAPIQQAGSMLALEVMNVPVKPSPLTALRHGWPVVLTLVCWILALLRSSTFERTGLVMLGWLFLGWGALRFPGGAVAGLAVLALFLVVHLFIPGIMALLKAPRRAVSTTEGPIAGGATAATTLIALLLCLVLPGAARAAQKELARRTAAARLAPGLPETVSHDIRVESRFVFGTATVRWHAEKGHTLPLLYEPAVLTGVSFPTNSLKLVHSTAGSTHLQQIYANEAGTYDLQLRYQVQLASENDQSFDLPVHPGLVNRVRLSLVNQDVQVSSPQAVSVDREQVGSNTVAQLILSPQVKSRIAWRPRSRDATREQAVYYAEATHVYVPSPGVIEGAIEVAVKPAQGELVNLTFATPPGMTITDVSQSAQAGTNQNQQAAPTPNLVSVWRFDPDARTLRLTLRSAQARTFHLLVRCQLQSGALPFEQTVGLITLREAAGQIGMLGLATGHEVQLDQVLPQGMSPVNLEDFPRSALNPLAGQFPGLTLRRAYRYTAVDATAQLEASAVQPDVRTESQFTLSMGEDRTVLAANATVNISRAGIFRLSFPLPENFAVESVSGTALSHWTDSRSNETRVITLHLNGRTEGQQTFAITLAGPGLRATNNYSVPKIVFREASKQTGTLLLVPEQGMRLQVATREGLSQLDPQRAGVRQKGVLAFRILQTPWTLTTDIEQVDAWVQVTTLQHATIAEAQVKTAANLQYQIENTGLKALRVYVPTNAESVRFTGDQVADFLRVPDSATNGLQLWEIKLHRRIIGAYRLQLQCQFNLPENASRFTLRGIVAADVNSQRGFVTIQSSGRVQVKVDGTPETLQATEWQSVPRGLRQGLEMPSAHHAFRMVEPWFELDLALQRHEAARLLPARVTSVDLHSVVSDNGAVLTQARLQMLPGDKRLLYLTLPQGAKFWFAFVNQNGVWPWRDGERILIPLEHQARGEQPLTVEFFYTVAAAPAGRSSLELNLLAPSFDLPLENISWRLSLHHKWQVDDWSGSLQLDERLSGHTAGLDLQSYLSQEQSTLRERSRQAESLLSRGNSALAQGDPQQARRAFQAAYGLSSHDAAFNEDARVQLNNVKMQQAVIGLNMLQFGNDPNALGGKLQELKNQREVNYTQQDAKEILDRLPAEDNEALTKLAGRIVQQQEAAVTSPGAIRASLPEQGTVLLFKRAVLVDPWAPLQLRIEAESKWVSPAGIRFLILGGLGLLLLVLLALRPRPEGRAV